MYALDFEYDNHRLSEFGFIICDFNATKGANVATAGSKISFNTVSMKNGRHHSLTSVRYEERIQTTFQICKNPDEYDDMSITNDEYRDLIRWLNRDEFLEFHVIYDEKDDPNREACYFDASFNVSKIMIGEVLYGLELEMFTNKPFGYGEERVFTNKFEDVTRSYIVTDFSDEVGTLYPNVRIACSNDSELVEEAGSELKIYNEFLDRTTVIRNCLPGETIEINGDSLIIESSEGEHDIANDFNYVFFKIGNSLTNRINKISVSMPCTIEIRYRPIIKDIP